MLDGDGFFDSPWPSDLRAEDGVADLSNFPNRANNSTLDAFLNLAEDVVGYSNNGAVYFRFRQPLNESLFPTPTESVAPDSTVFILNVDPESPDWGERIPVEVSFAEELTIYQPGNLLAVRPLYGFPMAPSTRYAAVVLEPLAQVTPEVRDWWSPDSPYSSHYASLRDALLVDGTDVESVAVASARRV